MGEGEFAVQKAKDVNEIHESRTNRCGEKTARRRGKLGGLKQNWSESGIGNGAEKGWPLVEGGVLGKGGGTRIRRTKKAAVQRMGVHGHSSLEKVSPKRKKSKIPMKAEQKANGTLHLGD